MLVEAHIYVIAVDKGAAGEGVKARCIMPSLCAAAMLMCPCLALEHSVVLVAAVEGDVALVNNWECTCQATCACKHQMLHCMPISAPVFVAIE